jgi:uncharacterized membrane protein
VAFRARIEGVVDMADVGEKEQRHAAGRSAYAGMLLAALSVPKSFERTLMPRTTRDQGAITGLSMAMTYAAGVAVQDAVENVASFFVQRRAGEAVDGATLRRATMVCDLAAVGAGIGLQRIFPEQQHESLGRAAVRSGGWLLTAGAASGFAAGFLQDVINTFDRQGRLPARARGLPVVLIGGAALAGFTEYLRRRREALAELEGGDDAASEESNVAIGRSLAIAGGVCAALVGLAVGERILATVTGEALKEGLPGGQRLWRTAGHLAALGALGALAYAGLDRVYQTVEGGTGKIEPAFDDPPDSPFVSGGPGSLVPWQTIGREGRRHVVTPLRKPWISAVMGEKAVADPIRVFVGLDSARTELERVNMAIAELERTGGFDRELLIAVSPTGTGYVNYVAVESAEYFTLGNCATVTLQYSKRPSPLSLDRVWEGRKQFRMLLAAIRRELYKRPPEKRPRLVVFGESLGAHTSQDAFVNMGTQGLDDAGVERALWIGTPHLSKWKAQVMGEERPDTDKSLVADVDNFGQIEAMSPEQRSKLRYVMVTHDNDGVGLFGPDLLIQKPAWLGDPSTRSRSVPKSMKWAPIVTAIQTTIDMNNAMSVVPGEFVARGHDYRADLARFVREVYDLKATDEQLEKVEVALRRYEGFRQAWMDAHDPKKHPEEIADLKFPSAAKAS